MSNMKSYQRTAEACERRWKTAMRDGNASEAYAATQDYQKNIQAQEEELKKMDPNSKEYAKAEQSIAEQRSNAWEMSREQRIEFAGEQKKQTYEELDHKNEQISRDMEKAVARGDTATYDSLRNQYEKNINTQETLGKQMKEEGVEYKDTVHQEKIDLKDRDIDMRNKMSEKIAEKESKGKSISPEEKANAEKYAQQVKKDEIEQVKYQNDKKIESMRERGASEAEIEYQKKENEESQKWVESINR